MTEPLLTLLQQAALEVANHRLDGVEPATPIAELGLDSVAVMELVAVLEERLAVRLSEDALSEVRTVGDLIALLEQARAAR